MFSFVVFMIQLLRNFLSENCFLRRWYSAGNAFLAAVYYGFPGKKMNGIGVTGTDGKTTTVEMISHVLRESGKRVLSLSTTKIQFDQQILLGNKRTTPNPWKIQKLLRDAFASGIDYFVLEVSSHALSQKRIYGTLFDVAVFTGITPEHLDYHRTFLEYQLVKKRLFTQYLKPEGLAVLNIDSSTGMSWAQEWLAAGKKVLSFSLQNGISSSWYAKNISQKKGGIEFFLLEKRKKREIPFFLPICGLFNVFNALSALQAVSFFGVSIQEGKKALSRFSGVPGRMEGIYMGQDFFVFIDFALTPFAFNILIQTAKKIAKERSIFLVFGSAGTHSDKQVRKETGKIISEQVDMVIVTDDEPYFEDPASIREDILSGVREVFGKDKNKYEQHTREIPDRKEAISFALKSAKRGDVVLIVGMGHLSSRNISGVEQEWSDKKVAQELLREMGYKDL
jgi:UDP-N-acetylmuramyl-tripeptide synthetase